MRHEMSSTEKSAQTANGNRTIDRVSIFASHGFDADCHSELCSNTSRHFLKTSRHKSHKLCDQRAQTLQQPAKASE